MHDKTGVENTSSVATLHLLQLPDTFFHAHTASEYLCLCCVVNVGEQTMVADRVKKSASQFFKKKVFMYSMPPTLSGVPYAGAKGMLRTMFGLDHLGDDALGIKNALLQV